MVHQHLIGQPAGVAAFHLHVHGIAEPGRFLLEGTGLDTADGAGVVADADREFGAFDRGRITAVDLHRSGTVAQILGEGDVGIGYGHRAARGGGLADIRGGGNGDTRAAFVAQRKAVDIDADGHVDGVSWRPADSSNSAARCGPSLLHQTSAWRERA